MLRLKIGKLLLERRLLLLRGLDLFLACLHLRSAGLLLDADLAVQAEFLAFEQQQLFVVAGCRCQLLVNLGKPLLVAQQAHLAAHAGKLRVQRIEDGAVAVSDGVQVFLGLGYLTPRPIQFQVGVGQFVDGLPGWPRRCLELQQQGFVKSATAAALAHQFGERGLGLGQHRDLVGFLDLAHPDRVGERLVDAFADRLEEAEVGFLPAAHPDLGGFGAPLV